MSKDNTNATLIFIISFPNCFKFTKFFNFVKLLYHFATKQNRVRNFRVYAPPFSFSRSKIVINFSSSSSFLKGNEIFPFPCLLQVNWTDVLND